MLVDALEDGIHPDIIIKYLEKEGADPKTANWAVWETYWRITPSIGEEHGYYDDLGKKFIPQNSKKWMESPKGIYRKIYPLGPGPWLQE